MRGRGGLEFGGGLRVRGGLEFGGVTPVRSVRDISEETVDLRECAQEVTHLFAQEWGNERLFLVFSFFSREGRVLHLCDGMWWKGNAGVDRSLDMIRHSRHDMMMRNTA